MDIHAKHECLAYRGMYVHTIVFESNDPVVPRLGPKWEYRLAIRCSARKDATMFGALDDEDKAFGEDYFTKAAAQQAASHYGKSAVDLVRGSK